MASASYPRDQGPHNRGRPPSSPSSSHVAVQERDSPSTPNAETKSSFSLGGLKTWFMKKKDIITGSLIPAEGRSSGRDDEPVEILECADQIEKDVITFQV